MMDPMFQERERELLFNEYAELSVWKDKKFLNIDGSYDYTECC